jgi:hypothetical protein
MKFRLGSKDRSEPVPAGRLSQKKARGLSASIDFAWGDSLHHIIFDMQITKNNTVPNLPCIAALLVKVHSGCLRLSKLPAEMISHFETNMAAVIPDHTTAHVKDRTCFTWLGFVASSSYMLRLDLYGTSKLSPE